MKKLYSENTVLTVGFAIREFQSFIEGHLWCSISTEYLWLILQIAQEAWTRYTYTIIILKKEDKIPSLK